MELYEYDSDPGEGEASLTRVSRPQSGVSEHEGGGVENVVAVSSDGSTVYFEASGRLTAQAPEGQGPYLYRYDTRTGATSYVALSGGYPSLHEPETTWYGSDVLASGQDVAGLWTNAPYDTTADGDFLVFPSTRDIAGYDSGGQQELYRYDSEAAEKHEQSIVCVSCNPNGSLPSFGATFTRSAMHGNDPSGAPPRAISERGEYVFFDSQESLLAQDTNGHVDVYEWESGGAGSCARAAGCLSSISSGDSSSDDFFLDSSSYVNEQGETVEGGDVFFGTHSKLVPADKDSQGDLYDARIDGGFPAPLGAVPCEGDACDNPPSLPTDAAPVTLAPSGVGNLPGELVPPSVKTVTKKTVKCKSGFVKKKVKKKEVCVKKPKSKRSAKKASRNGRVK